MLARRMVTRRMVTRRTNWVGLFVFGLRAPRLGGDVDEALWGIEGLMMVLMMRRRRTLCDYVLIVYWMIVMGAYIGVCVN